MDYDILILNELDSVKAIQLLAKNDGRELNDEEMAKCEAHLEKAESLKVKKAQAEALDTKMAAFEVPQARRTHSPVRVEVLDVDFTKEANNGFSSERDFFKAVLENPNQNNVKSLIKDPRLHGLMAAQGTDEQQTLSDELGGYL